MKRIFMLGLALVFMFSLSACGSNSGSSSTGDSDNDGNNDSDKETMKLKLSDDQPKDYPTVKGDEAFAKEVEEKTDGRIKIKVYPGGQLGSENDVAEQVQLGSVDFTRMNGSPLADIDEDMGVLSMPYLFESEEQKWKVLNGDIGQQLLDTLKSSKMVGLTYYDSGSRDFYNSKHPVKKPEDMKGLKIRVQKSKLNIDMIKALGASPTPMDYDEVYSSLKSGVIDGAENNFPSYYTTNHYKAAKYFTVDKHSGVPEVLIASKKTWDKLSDEDKDIMREAAKNSQKVANDAWDELVKKSKKEVKDGGAQITEVKDMDAWREAVQPIYDDYGKKYKDWIDKINEVK